MKFDTGTIVTIVVVMIFYLRLIVLQRQKLKVARYQYSAADKAKKKKNDDEPLKVQWSALGVRVRNWWIAGSGIVLIIFGAVVVGTQFLGSALSAAWWVPVNVGILLFALALR